MTPRSCAVVMCVLLAIPIASAVARPVGVLARPFPASALAAGTVAVHVDLGFKPQVGVKVALVAGKQRRTATTDDTGEAQFDHVKVGATVTVESDTSPPARSESFVVPESGGMLVALTVEQLPRQYSGRPMPRDGDGSTLDIRLTYNNLLEARPPTGVTVSLVGYASDGSVSVVKTRTDARGNAQFPGLDTSGQVAYYALAQLPRKPGADRLVSEAILPDETESEHVVLSGELRTATSAPVDDLNQDEQRTSAAPARGKLRVHLEGTIAPQTPIEVIDAATRKVVARGVVPDKELTVAAPVRAGQIVFVEASAPGGRFRSLPFEPVADRGADVTVDVLPRVLVSYQLSAVADDTALAVTADLAVQNNAWSPYRGPQGITVPLPHGATAAELVASPGTLGPSGIELGSLRPGRTEIQVKFELPARRGDVAFALDLPYGAYDSSVEVEQEAGLSIDHLPPGVAATTQDREHGTYLVIDGIMQDPGGPLAMTFHLPKPRPDTAALHACRRLRPEATPLVGKPVDFTLSRLDGGKFQLSGLRGRPVLLNLAGSWTGLSKEELPKLATLAGQLSIVVVASDRDPQDVTDEFGELPFPVVLDPPPGPDHPIGSVTKSWGVNLLPENLLVDRKGIVRFHFQTFRDWDTPPAIRCLKAFAASP